MVLCDDVICRHHDVICRHDDVPGIKLAYFTNLSIAVILMSISVITCTVYARAYAVAMMVDTANPAKLCDQQESTRVNNRKES